MPEVLTLSGLADAEPDYTTFENKTGLAEDMKFLASMPELCDVTFLVGDTREPVCAVKAVLASRSRVFQKMLYQAPSPQRKKDPPPRENKLRLFLKRSSEPLLNLQNAAQQPSGQQHQTLIIEEFEPDVFRQLIEYIHTGCVTLQPRTLLGVMNAADYYGLEELRKACAGFVQCCINVDTVCALLASAERYIQYKCTKSLVQKVLEFVDEHGNEVLNLGSFTLLPQHVVRLILAREELRADEFTKFQAALMWSKKYCDNNPNIPLKEVIGNFLEYIQFHKIPANVLMREIHPLGLVPYAIIMNALAYQADPASVDPGKLSPNSSRVRHPHSKHHQPKIRKAKSQSFRTRRSPSERRSPNSFIPFQGPLNLNDKRRSPNSQKSPGSLSQQESKSPGSSSSKSPFSLSRQGTLRSSHRRKNSMGTSLNLNPPGRRSPAPLSPQGRRSPGFLTADGMRSPIEFSGLGPLDRKSPTSLFPERLSPTSNIQIQGRRSPIGFYESDRRSPTSTVHVQDRKSPTINGLDDGRRSPTVQVQGRRSPIGFSQGLITCIPIVTPTDKRSPMGNMQIPPITVSNSEMSWAHISETCVSVDKTDKSPATTEEKPPSPVQERKERSVIREIIAFVRKPSKKTPPTTATTRTGRFANAFSRAESGSASPLLRQSTFSSSPAASSRAAKSAVTKQMSLQSKVLDFPSTSESKMSLKLLNSKMSLRLRRTTTDDKKKKSSGDEMSDMESSDSKTESSSALFELENVRFEKVGESYIKHDKIREETLEDASPSPVQVVALSEQLDCKTESEHDGNKNMDRNVELLKESLGPFFGKPPEPIYANLLEIQGEKSNDLQIQCPTFEIMPPSRRSSFDPPRSPFLENLKSPCDTDTELMHLNRLDSAGDSFEMVDTDRNRESSFESRYPSSSYTSFDISRYQSTSYEDQTSSFEIIDMDNPRGSIDQKSPIDLRKSSIELVNIETFQRSENAGRKSSLETHFEYQGPASLSTPKTKKQISEPNRCRDCFPNTLGMRTHYSAPNRPRSPLSAQTSSNYSSRDSYDSGFEFLSHSRTSHCNSELKSPFSDKSKQHFPLTVKQSPDTRSFLCTDQRCASIFEPRPGRVTASQLIPSSNEFEPPSPRRAASASPKHTFTFRIVLKKVDSSPDAICPSAERRRSRDRNERLRRRDSRKKRMLDSGKSF
ncbi:serine-enriched protein isoform X2 [Bradysia coprophila]|uniref:serine-enriched protein isoform X2 n=1 Tax=Bradysia coprophila TaxID=38358 RepID=UPI00187D75BE|nr:serine-enriched protein isoform X2 [Bradysia coprophila]